MGNHRMFSIFTIDISDKSYPFIAILGFRDKIILQICNILQIREMISFFYLSEKTQKFTVHIPHNFHTKLWSHFCEIFIINILRIENSICKILQICTNLLSRKTQLPQKESYGSQVHGNIIRRREKCFVSKLNFDYCRKVSCSSRRRGEGVMPHPTRACNK